MNILLVAYYFGDWKIGGSERNITEMASFFNARGHNCYVAVPDTARTELLDKKGIEYIRIKNIRSLNPFRLIRCVFTFAKILSTYNINSVCTLTFRLALQLGHR